MIDDILKERDVDQKPRFFLHDEMIAWLSDTCYFTTSVRPEGRYGLNLPYIDSYGQAYSTEYIEVATHFTVENKCVIEGKQIGPSTSSYIDLTNHLKIIQSLVTRVSWLEEAMKINNQKISTEIGQLVNNQVVMQNELVELKSKLNEKGTDNQ
jgi:hypothetical protein